MKNKHHKYLLPVIVLMIAGWFYWVQWRPAKIRMECWDYVIEKVNEPGEISNGQANNYYRICLVRRGLKVEDVIKY